MLRPPHVKVALLGLVAALVVGGATASLRDTESVFRGGDFETANLSQWRERQCLSERISVGSGRPAAFAGRYRARLEVRDRDVEPQTGSERCELVGAELPRERERWFRQAIYVPTASDPPDSWQIMAQWYSNSGGSPPLALFNDTGLPMRWSLRSGDSTRVYWRSRELRRNRWHEIVVGVYLSESRKRGWVEVWLDGRRQQLKNGKARMYGRTRGSDSGYFKTGLYRNPRSRVRSIQYVDEAAVGSSRASVMSD